MTPLVEVITGGFMAAYVVMWFADIWRNRRLPDRTFTHWWTPTHVKDGFDRPD